MIEGRLTMGLGLRLEKNDKGLDHLMVAAKADRNIVDEVVRIGYNYLRMHKNAAAAEQWLDEFNEVLG